MLHPSVRLLAWGEGVMFSLLLPIFWLALASALVIALAAGFARARLGLLLRRVRWLIVSLLLLFALATPGVYLLPVLGGLSPTGEGLRLGVEHALRLLVVLAALALLLESTGVEGLLSGLHGLMRPLACLGIDRSRVAVRLMLVLRYAEQAPPGRHWRRWLEEGQALRGPDRLRIQRQRLTGADVAVLAVLTFAVVAYAGTAS